MRRRNRNRHIVSAPRPIVVIRRRVPAPMQLIEDRRLFHPARDLRPVRSFFTRPRLVISPAKRPLRNGAHFRSPLFPSHRVGFDIPRKVLICVRRKTRKEVIIAKRVAPSGGGSKHFNIWSEVSC